MFEINDIVEDTKAIRFCQDFMSVNSEKRYIFGRNEFAQSIASKIDVCSFVDDFTQDVEYLGKPVIKTEDIPEDGLVVVAVTLGRPVTVEKKLSDINIRNLDYYAFYKYSGIELLPVVFWDKFAGDFEVNNDKYEWIYSIFEDDESKRIFNKIINFRLSCDLSYMHGFSDRQKEQYFEEFLGLNKKGEVFVDIGGFDGTTSMEFIKRCPEYKKVYLFEPELENMNVAKSRLGDYKNIIFVQMGVSDTRNTVRFSIGGSASAISESGEVEIKVNKLDEMMTDNATYIKMDIEGSETQAIDGASQTIKRCHPRLAICVYHKANDLWSIPHQILSIRDDYKIYLRHYTEGVTETVMFFVPR